MFGDSFLPIAKGICKKLLVHRKYSLRTFGTNDSRYCYSVWLRHLIYAHQAGFRFNQTSIAEFGPGDSLGMGLAALISGAEKYYAMDVYKYWNIQQNLHMFDMVVDLFRNKTAIPDQAEFPKVFPLLDDYRFPEHILPDKWMNEMLAPERIQILRNEIVNIDRGDNKHIHYLIPWNNRELIKAGSIDYFFSQAVLEYVDDLPRAYRKFNMWIKIGGLMTHCIDFSAHGITKSWNAHWLFSPSAWKLTHGNNKILLNRAPKSEHQKLLEDHEFLVVDCKDKIRKDGLMPERFHKNFSALSNEDAVTYASFFVAKKSADLTN